MSFCKKFCEKSPFKKDDKLDKQVNKYNNIQYPYKGTKQSGKIPILDQIRIT